MLSLGKLVWCNDVVRLIFCCFVCLLYEKGAGPSQEIRGTRRREKCESRKEESRTVRKDRRKHDETGDREASKPGVYPNISNNKCVT